MLRLPYRSPPPWADRALLRRLPRPPRSLREAVALPGSLGTNSCYEHTRPISGTSFASDLPLTRETELLNARSFCIRSGFNRESIRRNRRHREWRGYSVGPNIILSVIFDSDRSGAVTPSICCTLNLNFGSTPRDPTIIVKHLRELFLLIAIRSIDDLPRFFNEAVMFGEQSEALNSFKQCPRRDSCICSLANVKSFQKVCEFGY